MLIYNGVMKELSIPLPNYITNNQAEVYAVIAGLQTLKEPCRVDLWSDSDYMRRGITEWIQGWKRRGWKTTNKKSDVKNRELWEELDKLTQTHDVTFHWEKGHADNEFNIIADRLAREAAESLEKNKEG